MELWETILISVLIAIIIPAVFSVIWFFKARGEKKLIDFSARKNITAMKK